MVKTIILEKFFKFGLNRFLDLEVRYIHTGDFGKETDEIEIIDLQIVPDGLFLKAHIDLTIDDFVSTEYKKKIKYEIKKIWQRGA